MGEDGQSVVPALIAALRVSSEAEGAARTLKKISAADRSLLFPWRKQLLEAAFRAQDLRVQWNLTIVVGRLPLHGQDRALAMDLMFERLRSRSGLNRTFAMQALVDLSSDDRELRARVRPIVEHALEHGTAAMQARARKLLKGSPGGAGLA